MTISAERPTKSVATSASPPTSRGVSWTQRPGWMSQHLGTAIVVAVLGYTFGHWLGTT